MRDLQRSTELLDQIAESLTTQQLEFGERTLHQLTDAIRETSQFLSDRDILRVVLDALDDV